MNQTVNSNDLLQGLFTNVTPLLSKCAVFVNPDRPLRVIYGTGAYWWWRMIRKRCLWVQPRYPGMDPSCSYWHCVSLVVFYRTKNKSI